MRHLTRKYVEANPDDPTVAMLRAIYDAGLNAQFITPADPGPYRATPDNTIPIIDDSADLGPHHFNMSSLRKLIESAACITLNSGPCNANATKLFLAGQKLGKSVLIECGPHHAPDWTDYVRQHKRADAGFFAILADSDPTKLN